MLLHYLPALETTAALHKLPFPFASTEQSAIQLHNQLCYTQPVLALPESLCGPEVFFLSFLFPFLTFKIYCGITSII